MKLRLVRLAARRWNLSIADAAVVFAERGIFSYIENNFDLFHIQGDDAILEDIFFFLENTKC